MLFIAKRAGRRPRIFPCTRRLERVVRLAASSRPPPFSFAQVRQVEQLGLPRQRPALGARYLGGNRAPSSLRHTVTPRTVGGVVCRRTRRAARARSMPHVKKNVRSIIDSAAVLLGQSADIEKKLSTGYGREHQSLRDPSV